MNRRILTLRLKNHRRTDLRLIKGQKTSYSKRSELFKRMYSKDSENNYKALKTKRIIRKANKKKNERAFVFKKPIFQPLRKLKE